MVEEQKRERYVQKKNASQALKFLPKARFLKKHLDKKTIFPGARHLNN